MYWECGECGGLETGERPNVCSTCGTAATPMVPADVSPPELSSMRELWLRAGFDGRMQGEELLAEPLSY